MATELNLHHAFYTAFSETLVSDDERKDCLEKTRLWYLLYVLDHQSSIAYTRPSSMSELRPIKDFELLLQSASCTPADRALIAQVTGLVALGRAFDHFGLNPRRTMAGDDASILNHSRFADSVQTWYDRWSVSESDLVARDVNLQYHFSNLVLHSLVLRGRPLDKLSEMPYSLRPLALKAIDSAHAVIQHFMDDPDFVNRVAGVPLYVHSTIAFAVVFLLKLAYKWHVLGISINPKDRTIPLIEDVTRVLRACKVGANHMVFSMAKGFERMLRQLASDHATQTEAARPVVATEPHRDDSNEMNDSHQPSSPAFALAAGQFHVDDLPRTTVSASDWELQDEELWSVAMGYDLLEPSLHGLSGYDFNSSEW